jgi:hypothetical protein
MTQTPASQRGSAIVKLIFAKTTVPAQFLNGANGKHQLILPTYAQLSRKAESLLIEVRLRGEDVEWWESDASDLPIASMELDKREILKLRTGVPWYFDGYSRNPAATLSIRDPLDLVEELELTFASVDQNNPEYLIKALAQILETLGVTVESPPPDRDDEIPF